MTVVADMRWWATIRMYVSDLMSAIAASLRLNPEKFISILRRAAGMRLIVRRMALRARRGRRP